MTGSIWRLNFGRFAVSDLGKRTCWLHQCDQTALATFTCIRLPRHVQGHSASPHCETFKCNCLEYGRGPKQWRITPLLYRKCRSVARRLADASHYTPLQYSRCGRMKQCIAFEQQLEETHGDMQV